MFDAKKVLVIGAHPDDEILGVGGTIPVLKRRGAHVTILIVTDGSSTQYAGDRTALETKVGEANAAARVVGADELILWDYPDMRLDTVAHADLNRAIESLLQDRQFDTVFTHFPHDINRDHQVLARSTMVACRPHPGQTVMNVYTYWVNSSTDWGHVMGDQPFRPNTYVDIESTIEIKLEAMEQYATETRQFPHPRSIEALRHRSIVHGSEVGLKFAEPFMAVLQRVRPD